MRQVRRMIKMRFERQVGLSVGLLCVALIAASGGGAMWIAEREAMQRIERESVQLAGTMAASLDNAMFERFREMRIVSGLRPLEAAWHSDPAAIRTVLETLQVSLPAYAWIGFATPDGTVRAATGSLLEGASVEARPWFKAALAGPAVSDVHEALLLAKLLYAAPQAEPFRLVDVSMPVYGRSHELIGVLGAHLSWKWAEEVRTQILARSGVAGSADVWILSSEGKVLLGPRFGDRPFGEAALAEIRLAKHGAFEDGIGTDPIETGYRVTSGYKDYPGLGWIVVARRPVSVAYASVHRSILSVLALSAATAFVGILLAWLLARRTAAPLRLLTAAVHRIGRDPAATTLPRLGGASEFVELSSSLRSLLRRLGIAERGLTAAEERSIDTSRRFQQDIDVLRQQADCDSLTGLLNRRAFLVFAEDAIPYYRRYRRSVAVLMVDIDRFKVVNDTFGHAAGDVVLARVADVLRLIVRATDKVSRFGGEEFVVLLREIGEGDAVVLAERMREAVERESIRITGRAVKVTISIGVALVSDQDADIQSLIERADQALYEAKNGGRNRLRLHGRPSMVTLGRAA